MFGLPKNVHVMPVVPIGVCKFVSFAYPGFLLHFELNNINNYNYRSCELKHIEKHKRTKLSNNNCTAIFKNIFIM